MMTKPATTPSLGGSTFVRHASVDVTTHGAVAEVAHGCAAGSPVARLATDNHCALVAACNAIQAMGSGGTLLVPAGISCLACGPVFSTRPMSILGDSSDDWSRNASAVLVFPAAMTADGSTFICSLNESEQLNAELDRRIERKQSELQANFQYLQQSEREQAIAEERNRIMSDMHDGIGAQLISTIGLAEQGRLSQEEMAAALRECLDDLRLTIDSLERTDNDLLPALGNFRYRVGPRLQQNGITLDWSVDDLPRLPCLTPHNLLHLLRILQEAFTNVLKHTQASLIRVETGLHADDRQVFIRVSDNGTGFSGEHRGRGLANMRQRAERIGGILNIAPTASGTTLELLLPVS